MPTRYHTRMICSTVVTNCVKKLRTRKGLRQSDLAEIVGVTRQTILAIEKGRLNPSILICLRIAAALGEPVSSLFFLEPPGAALDRDDGAAAERN